MTLLHLWSRSRPKTERLRDNVTEIICMAVFLEARGSAFALFFKTICITVLSALFLETTSTLFLIRNPAVFWDLQAAYVLQYIYLCFGYQSICTTVLTVRYSCVAEPHFLVEPEPKIEGGSNVRVPSSAQMFACPALLLYNYGIKAHKSACTTHSIQSNKACKKYYSICTGMHFLDCLSEHIVYSSTATDCLRLLARLFLR